MTELLPSTETGVDLVHVAHTDGHHASYQRLMNELFGMQPSVGRVGFHVFFKLCRARRTFFATIDDDLFGFASVAMARILLGRRTAGLFVRANSCEGKGPKVALKRAVYAALCRLPGVSIISILPYEVAPGARQVTTHAVQDPQCWDIADKQPKPDLVAAQRFETLAAGRPILAYFGWATVEKGFPILADLIAKRPDLAERFKIIAIGKVTGECRQAADILCAAGAEIWDRFVTDEEMEALYSVCALVWCKYAPEFDQASGIFGRSVQYGKRPVVKDHPSIIGAYIKLLEMPAVALPDAPDSAADMLLASAQQKGKDYLVPHDVFRQWRKQFIETVEATIGERS
jgi:hypothetical protein